MSKSSAKETLYAFRPPKDVKRLVERAQKLTNASKTKLIVECLRLGLAEYAGKKEQGVSDR